MRHGLLALLCVSFFAVPGRGQSLPKGVEVVRDDARILILRAPSAEVVAAHKAAIVVPLEDGPNRKMGEAYWSGDASAAPATGRIVLQYFVEDGIGYLIGHLIRVALCNGLRRENVLPLN